MVKWENMTTEEVLLALTESGRKLLFVDDGGTPGKPLKELVKDFVLMCGIVIDSESYSDITMRISDHLRHSKIPLDELHATEIVNPSTSSQWYAADYGYRLQSIELLGSILIEYAGVIPYIYIGKEQYKEIKKNTGTRKKHKKGVKEVFYYAALTSDWLGNDKCAVFYDLEENLEGRMRLINLGRQNLLGGGIFEASSNQVHGLQVADFAAYTLNRIFHIRDRVKEKGKKINSFDAALLEIYEKTESRYQNMLDKL